MTTSTHRRVARPGPTLTVPDLVVLAMLTEHPMHGYQLNQLLEEWEVRDWAEISRPQVYYSLKKLRDLGLVTPVSTRGGAAGPRREVFTPTARGTRALRNGLAATTWAEQRPPPPFLTWVAMARHARPDEARAVLAARRRFLEREIRKEERTLEGFSRDDGQLARVGEAMVELTLRQFRTELAWLDELEIRLGGS